MKKKQRRQKITTIEGLATVILDVREEIDTRFDAIDVRFDAIEALLKAVDSRLTALESKLAGVERRLDTEAMERLDIRSVFERLERLEKIVMKR